MKFCFMVLTFLVVHFLLCSDVAAQNRRLEGVISDASGRPIEGAHISVTQARTAVATATSNEQGEFAVSLPKSEQLIVRVEASGFESFERRLLDDSASLNITLAPASVTASVTVAATRVSTPLNQTAASVTTITGKDLQSTSAATLDDALRQVPGFSLFRRSGSRTANPTSQGVSLRGVGASGASRAVVLVDDVPLNDPFGGWVYWDRVPRESISEVEVVQGAASHLYGSAALGGVIDITTKSEQANTLTFVGSAGNEQTVDGSLFASAGSGNASSFWSASLGAEIFHTDGYILVAEGQGGPIDAPAGTRNSVFNPFVARSFNANASVFARASFFGEARSNGTPLQTNRTHLRQFILGGDLSNKTAGSFSGRAYGGTQLFDQNFTAVSADRRSETPTRVQRVPAQSLGGSLNWSRVVTRQTIVAGMDAQEVRGFSNELAFVNGRATSYIDAGGRERTLGLFVEDLVRVNSHLFLTPSLRFDRWNNYAAFTATRPITASTPTSVTSFPNREERAFSPQLAIVYQVNGHASLFASMSRAFRAPTLNELYRSFRVGNVLTLANENLQAERLTGGEAGTRIVSSNNRVSFRGSYFWNEITKPVANVTLLTTPNLITRQRQNLGRTRSLGVDVSAEVDLTKRWNLSAGYLFADATVVSFPANVTLEGLQLPQVPRHQFTFQTRYANPRVVTVAFQGRASSSQFDDDQNLFRLDRYFTLDAYVSHQLNRKLEMFAAFENVFDQRYEVGKTPVTTLGPPFLLRAGLRLQLGSR